MAVRPPPTAMPAPAPTDPALQPYLAASPAIDHDHPAVADAARRLAEGAADTAALVQRCFEFVRDAVRHSADFRLNPVTWRASDVLQHRTGYCYAKSHLLAALLRANGVPTGLCYQRLSVGDGGQAPYCLHGLNAVHLPGTGWLRLDARGNKPGVDAQFCPPQERLAFPIVSPEERDLPEVWAEPLPLVLAALQRHATWDALLADLPDLPLLPAARR